MFNLECYGNEIQLPKYLIQNPHLLKYVISSETWNSILTREQKVHLLKFLPTFPSNDTEEKIATLKLLFNDTNFNFENPINTAARKIQDKEFSPGTRARKLIDLIMKERQRVRSLLSSRLNILRDILDKKQRNGIELSEKELICLRKWTRVLNELPSPEKKAEERMKTVINKIENKVAQGRVNDSDQETEINSDVAMMRGNPNGYLERLLSDHQKKLKSELCDYPEMDTYGISLAKIRRSIEEDRKNNDIELPEVDDDFSNSSEQDAVSEGDSYDEASSREESLDQPLEDQKTDFICPTWPHSSFFIVLYGFFKQSPNAKLTTVQVEERVREWQEKRRKAMSKEKNPSDLAWMEKVSDWVSVTNQAMRYLCAESGQCQPYIEYKPRLHLWRWIGPMADSDSDTEDSLDQLFYDWLDNRDQSTSEEVKQLDDEQVPSAYCPTDYTIEHAQKRDVQSFRVQEAERFTSFSRPYVYRCEGNYLATVGPVAQIQKSTKARGHALLRSDRPAVVNLVEIVRDAVARLPNGEGSKQDIVTLALDSAYWVPNADIKQISQCISSALDRLQCESVDPPVKYISAQKLWIYRHRHRTPEDFQRLFHKQKALESAKLSQKVSKPRTNKSMSSGATNSYISAARKSKPTTLSNQKPSTSNQSWSHLNWPSQTNDDYYDEDLDDEFEDDMWNYQREDGSDDEDDDSYH